MDLLFRDILIIEREFISEEHFHFQKLHLSNRVKNMLAKRIAVFSLKDYIFSHLIKYKQHSYLYKIT